MTRLRLKSLIDESVYVESYTDSDLRVDIVAVDPKRALRPRYFHWRLIDEGRSEIEIDIAIDTGELLGLSLVLLRDAQISCSTRVSDSESEGILQGIRGFDASFGKEVLRADPRNTEVHFHNVAGTARIDIQDDEIRIRLLESEVFRRIETRDKKLRFGFDRAGDLSEVSIWGLAPEQLLPFRRRSRSSAAVSFVPHDVT